MIDRGLPTISVREYQIMIDRGRCRQLVLESIRSIAGYRQLVLEYQTMIDRGLPTISVREYQIMIDRV